jgi:hypothetical protein
MRIAKKYLSVILICFFGTVFVAAAENSQLMPDDIIKMHKSGLSSEQIVSQILKRDIGFDVNLPVLEKLVNNGISSGVIEVLMGRNQSVAKPSREFFPAGPRQPGITIVTDPPGLDLYIDGKSHGVTPGLSNKLSKGKHILKVEHPLFFARQEEINFDGENDIYLRWKMEPREPVVRVDVNIDRARQDEAWSWIVRPRNQCPGCDVTLQLTPWRSVAISGQAVFLLNDETKRLFRGSGTACVELNLWRGEIRRDLPIRHLPVPTLRYFISDIRINGIELVDVTVNIRIKEIDQALPDVSLVSDTGFLIPADQAPGNSGTRPAEDSSSSRK